MFAAEKVTAIVYSADGSKKKEAGSTVTQEGAVMLFISTLCW
jgi:hypothetical protein